MAAAQPRLRELSASLRALGAQASDKVRRISISRAGKR